MKNINDTAAMKTFAKLVFAATSAAALMAPPIATMFGELPIWQIVGTIGLAIVVLQTHDDTVKSGKSRK